MKAILKFDLDDPDDAMAHKRCIHSTGLALVIWEMIHNSRKCENIDDMHDLITQKCDENGIVIDDIIV
jgi:hypothetical protein